jgi:hypothetical protein
MKEFERKAVQLLKKHRVLELRGGGGAVVAVDEQSPLRCQKLARLEGDCTEGGLVPLFCGGAEKRHADLHKSVLERADDVVGQTAKQRCL